MPMFEYQCQGCGHVFEKFQFARLSAINPGCPECQGTQTDQLLSRFSSPSGNGGGFACAPSAFS
jgi:putative FmdB family regulatory protein